ncbi:DUF1127 domain-containing protein [Rhodobacteraceae bacterium 2CG4]|uniref:DUF1127 domain-containing protein n=1 Tax=Halovulum marinum TaxID=2662447 RepID=A0A6L5Z411_9RHOB|nr:DUF1127 domain-containing protein [Halovulum marinum]MSU91288.1 DUF1127 domain-containing protein [Halovulum marinum]
MYISHAWLFAHSSPEMAEVHRLATEARAAAVYATWRRARSRLGRLFAAFGRIRLARRQRRNLATLQALPPELLRDIGLAEGELRDIAEVTARHAGPDGLTVAAARRLAASEAASAAGEPAPVPQPIPQPVRLTVVAAPRRAARRSGKAPVIPLPALAGPRPAACAHC